MNKRAGKFCCHSNNKQLVTLDFSAMHNMCKLCFLLVSDLILLFSRMSVFYSTYIVENTVPII